MMVIAADEASSIFSDRGLSFQYPTDPKRCVVLVALPISCKEFLEDYRRWPEHDYARFVSAYDDPETAWKIHGFRLAGSLEQLLEAATSSGMQVVPAAKSGDFKGAFSGEGSVVILISHWRGSRLLARDLTTDPENILDIVRKSDPIGLPVPAVEELRFRVSAALNDVPTNLRQLERREYFSGGLTNRVIRGKPLLPGLLDVPKGEHLIVGDIWLETLHRDVLDICATPAIIPGNRVELRDGLHSVTSLSTKVSNEWSGLADLTMCRSVILGHRLKNGRSDRAVIVRTKTVDPTLALVVLRRLLLDVGTGKFNYAARYAELFAAATRFVDQLS